MAPVMAPVTAPVTAGVIARLVRREQGGRDLERDPSVRQLHVTQRPAITPTATAPTLSLAFRTATTAAVEEVPGEADEPW